MNETIEQELIGTMISNPKICGEVFSKLKVEDFYGSLSRKVFKEISRQVSRSGEPDISSMPLADIERNMVMDWADMGFSSSGFRPKIDYVLDNSRRRSIKSALETAMTALADGADLSVVCEGIQEVGTISTSSQKPYHHALNLIDDFLTEVEEPKIPSGIAALQSLIEMKPGQLGIIAARPGVGKSSLARQIAGHMSLSGPVLFNSNEMSYREVIKAQMSMMLKISSHRMTPAELTDGEKARIRDLAPKINLRLSEHNTPAEIENAVRIMDAAGEKPVAVIVDYIQIMTCGDHKLPRHEAVSRITRELKIIAQKYDILIIALSQFNRDAANDAPALHHLRESGSIEQDANWVLAIHADQSTKDTMRELIVLKNRSGSTGSRAVRWFPEFTLMADL